MKLKHAVTMVSYSIEIPLDVYMKLEDWETEQPEHNCLYSILEKNTNARNVDYNGHYGNFIYFSLEVEDNTRKELKKIKLFIQQHIVNHLS